MKGGTLPTLQKKDYKNAMNNIHQQINNLDDLDKFLETQA